MVDRLRYSARTTASPTATSPAATAIVNTPNTWPVRLLSWRLKAMRFRLAAFMINSIDIRMTMTLRRISTPIMPIENSSRLMTRTWEGGTGMSPSAFLDRTRQDDGGDHRDQQEQRRDLERQQVVREDRLPHRLEVAALPQYRGGLVDRRDGAAAVDRQDDRDDGQPQAARDDTVRPDLRSRGVAQVDQHDDEEEQHHDATGV